MDAARQGIVTPQMKIVAEKEHYDAEALRELIAKGEAIIPCNRNHKSLSPSGVGAKLKTKINVNLGVSRDWKDVDMEYEKVRSAVEMGAEAIMDLSSYGDTRSFRRKLTAECPAMIGTVPIYDAVVYYHKALGKITSEEWIDIVRMHAEDGVDFMTIHCGMNRATAERFKNNKRLMNIVSRGGSIMFAWMEMTGKENPFYEHFDEILDICREYDITLSLGDALPSGLSGGRHRYRTDRGTDHSWRTDEARLGERCSGNDRRTGPYASEPDRRQYGDPENTVPRRALLRAGSYRDRCCAGI